jgi:hypothetical protein
MLGMMNAPLDNNPPEFYAGNPGSSSNELFGRKRSIISYLEDGRKLVNGEMEVIFFKIFVDIDSSVSRIKFRGCESGLGPFGRCESGRRNQHKGGPLNKIFIFRISGGAAIPPPGYATGH